MGNGCFQKTTITDSQDKVQYREVISLSRCYLFCSQPLKVSVSTSCDLLGSEDNFVVKMCEVEGKYIFTPTQMKGSGMTLTKYITLLV